MRLGDARVDGLGDARVEGGVVDTGDVEGGVIDAETSKVARSIPNRSTVWASISV
jgi:hypothetical protein